MNILPLGVTTTPARREFKRLVGQNNHFLVTICVGLAAVEAGAPAPEDLSAAWNPRNSEVSARRSREYACKALLEWTKSALDAYVTAVRKLPYVDSETESAMEQVGSADGVLDRIAVLAKWAKCDEITHQMVQLMLVWRGVLVHRGSTKDVSAATRKRLLKAHDEIAERYRGLDIARAVEASERRLSPTLKEVTSLASATHEFVQVLDSQAVACIDPERLLVRSIASYLDVDPVGRAANIWGRDLDARRSTIVQIAMDGGMSRLESGGLSSAFIDSLLAWGPTDARKWHGAL